MIRTLAFLLLFAIANGQFNNRWISLKSVHGTYVRAFSGGDATVDTQSFIGGWEKFQVIPAGGNKVALRTAHGQYLRAYGGGAGATVTTQTFVGTQEKFELQHVGNEKYAIKTHAGTFLRVHAGAPGGTVDTQTYVGGWEKFEIVSDCYYCGRKLNEIFIIMTHNSYAYPGPITAFNQNFGPETQYNDGIRGFNLDVYDGNNCDLRMYHGLQTDIGVDYSSEATKLKDKVGGKEFIVVQLEDHVSCDVEKLTAPFGNKLIKNFDVNKPLGYYMDKGQYILLVTDKGSHHEPSSGIHKTDYVIVENQYSWGNFLTDPPFNYRRGTGSQSASLMSYFITPPSIVAADNINRKNRALYHIRQYLKKSSFHHRINILLVDFYNEGDVMGIQTSIRNKDFNAGCWNDGSICGLGTTCWDCCRPSEYWYSKAFTACGEEPCWSDGTICAAGTTCNACCNGYEHWWGSAITKCGEEPCWSSGTICGWGTTCNACCSGAHCPWYQFGVCTCH